MLFGGEAKQAAKVCSTALFKCAFACCLILTYPRIIPCFHVCQLFPLYVKGLLRGRVVAQLRRTELASDRSKLPHEIIRPLFPVWLLVGIMGDGHRRNARGRPLRGGEA